MPNVQSWLAVVTHGISLRQTARENPDQRYYMGSNNVERTHTPASAIPLHWPVWRISGFTSTFPFCMRRLDRQSRLWKDEAFVQTVYAQDVSFHRCVSPIARPMFPVIRAHGVATDGRAHSTECTTAYLGPGFGRQRRPVSAHCRREVWGSGSMRMRMSDRSGGWL